MAYVPYVSLLFFITLILLVDGRLNLDSSDHNTLLTIQNDLRGDEKRRVPSILAGVFCERRISNNSYVLRVTRISLNSQQLRGFLPPAIAQLSELKELSLPNNHLVDRIPTQIVDCRKLEILNLRNNRFSGGVPTDLSSLVYLRHLDLSSNMLSGNLNFLTYFPNLETLSLADNLFAGKVPASLESFKNLRSFDISMNRFIEGPVPVVMNQLAETVPKRYILEENSTMRNKTTTAIIEDSVQASHKLKILSKRLLWSSFLGFISGIPAAALSVLVLSIIYKIFFDNKTRGGNAVDGRIFQTVVSSARMNFDFLLQKDALESLQVIGRGGCGNVYIAELPGRLIAIKKIKYTELEQEEVEEDLINRKSRIKSSIQTFGLFRHRNLLPPLAHVSKLDCYYIVSEFMSNGSLLDILNRAWSGDIELDWLARLRIALGVASGLEYLHTDYNPHIIHRDIKPSNILLDDNMEARIADFGVSKAIPHGQDCATVSHMAGTWGYMAPECGWSFWLTDKCDVYSLGVVLGVLVMGKLPTDKFFQQDAEMSFVGWMRNVLNCEDPKGAIDPTLMAWGGEYEEQMYLVLKIACVCTLDDPKERPNSGEVRSMLSQIQEIINIDVCDYE